MATPTSRPRPFWLQRKWVVGHVLVVALVSGAVWAGFWQLDRRDQERTESAEIATRSEAAPVPVQEILDVDDPHEVGEEVRYRRATAEGTFDADDEVLIRSQMYNGNPGSYVVTPLVLDDGTAIAVNRGFVPGLDLEEAAAAAPAPEGRVEIEGILLDSQRRRGIGPTDPPEGTLDALARIDVERLAQQVDADLYPVFLQQLPDGPTDTRQLPIPVPAPAQDDGQRNLSYAGQWFLFALIGAVGWPILLRHTAQEEDRSAPPEAVPAADDDEDRRVGTPTSTAG